MSTVAGLILIAGFICAAYALGAAHTVRRRDRGLEVMGRQVDAHLLFADRQFKKQLAAERDRRKEERVELAYDALGRWLHDLDRTIDEVWSGADSTEESIREKAELIVRNWPWETLAVPVEASGARLYWGSEVRALIRKFQGESSHFINRARVAVDPGLMVSVFQVGEVRRRAVRRRHQLGRAGFWGAISTYRGVATTRRWTYA